MGSNERTDGAGGDGEPQGKRLIPAWAKVVIAVVAAVGGLLVLQQSVDVRGHPSRFPDWTHEYGMQAEATLDGLSKRMEASYPAREAIQPSAR